MQKDSAVPLSHLGMLTRIAALYVIQGVPLGLGYEAIPTLLRDVGAPLSSLAWLPLIGLPWMFNVLWAPVVDNRWKQSLGKRRSWIIPTQLCLATGVFVLAVIPFTPDNVTLILIVATVTSVFAATQDIAVDGLAAETLPSSALTYANAVQVGGMALGLLLGGSGVMIVTEWAGHSNALILLGTMVILALLPTLMWSEPSIKTMSMDKPKAKIRLFFSRENAWPVLWLGLVATLAGTVLHGLWRLILVDLGWSVTQIAYYSAIGYTSFMLVGSVAARPLINLIGLRLSGVTAMLLAGIATIGWIGIANGVISAEPLQVLSYIILCALGISISSVVVFSLVMQYAQNGSQPGTDFTVFQSSHVVMGVVASSIAIALSQSYGFIAGLLISIVICVMAILSFLFFGRKLLASVKESAAYV